MYNFCMTFLLIDNGTTLLEKLKRAIPGEVVIRAWNEIHDIRLRDFDGVILSGGSLFEVVGNEKKLRDEMRLIHDDKKLLIGICYGCELIAETFGGLLEKGLYDHHGVTEIRAIDDVDIFDGQKQFSVYEHHRWLVKTLPSVFVPLAKSDHGIEVFRHVDRPMYGLQFHPEQFEKAGDGERIFLNILKKELQ